MQTAQVFVGRETGAVSPTTQFLNFPIKKKPRNSNELRGFTTFLNLKSLFSLDRVKRKFIFYAVIAIELLDRQLTMDNRQLFTAESTLFNTRFFTDEAAQVKEFRTADFTAFRYFQFGNQRRV